MKKKDYSAPKMVQVKMEAEMPVICTSGSDSNFSLPAVDWGTY